jgi:hypothetical protein
MIFGFLAISSTIVPSIYYCNNSEGLNRADEALVLVFEEFDLLFIFYVKSNFLNNSLISEIKIFLYYSNKNITAVFMIKFIKNLLISDNESKNCLMYQKYIFSFLAHKLIFKNI